jgi:hypothetical protein
MTDLKNNNDFVKIKRIEAFPSQHVAARTVDIWLPKDIQIPKKYQVRIMDKCF